MARGRKPNHDKRITALVQQLKDAIFARERAALEARIETHVGSLVGSFRSGRAGTTIGIAASTRGAPANPGRGNRKPRSAASRRAQSLKMKRYWADRRKAESSKGS